MPERKYETKSLNENSTTRVRPWRLPLVGDAKLLNSLLTGYAKLKPQIRYSNQMSHSAKFASAIFICLRHRSKCHHAIPTPPQQVPCPRHRSKCRVHAAAASAIAWAIRDQCSWSAENRGHEFHRDWRWVRHLVRISNLCLNSLLAVVCTRDQFHTWLV